MNGLPRKESLLMLSMRCGLPRPSQEVVITRRMSLLLRSREGWVNVQATTDQRAAERSLDSEQKSIIRSFYRLQHPEARTETSQGSDFGNRP